ncbi:hypothetical protein HMI56_004394 [Coelomomyces lativittatus]|nr:hypothetical protein HMI56_004394 [Coelomomyces lativittatus]
MILKSDHFPQGAQRSITGIHLLDCPNFRTLDLNVYGVAQPTTTGFSTILTLLKCNTASSNTASDSLWISTREEPLVYICGLPYALREQSRPFENIKGLTGISSSRLEKMEARLREDIIKEAQKYNGLLLVHHESGSGDILPSWVAADTVQTPHQVIDFFQEHCIQYTRIPVGPDQPPDGYYLDAYVKSIIKVSLDAAVVVNCGMGGGRTTLGTVVALLIRYRLQNRVLESVTSSPTLPLLRVMYLLERGLSAPFSPHSAIEWALARGALMDQMVAAVQGNFNIILDLVKLLEAEGDIGFKPHLDAIIDHCDAVINLREEILFHRIKHSADHGTDLDLKKACFSLLRYFYLVAFSAFSIGDDFEKSTFSDWLAERPEINQMALSLKSPQLQLQVFRPVEDLSLLAGQEEDNVSEVESFVLSHRNGTLLTPGTLIKIDTCSDKTQPEPSSLPGTYRFRKIPNSNIFGVSQPTAEGFKNVIDFIQRSKKKDIIWITMREEPLVYIKNSPYVIRDQSSEVRCLKSYRGITAERLALLEDRLSDDVVDELQRYDGKVLIHHEDHSIWLDLEPDDVQTLKSIVHPFPLKFFRIPITPQKPPGPADFDYLVRLVVQYPSDIPIVVNCQMGMGRTTTGTISIWLIREWLNPTSDPSQKDEQHVLFKCVHSLLRVIRDGIKVKQKVDRAIEACSQYFHLTKVIEADRQDPAKASRALLQLCRYFTLLLFQAYLNDNTGATMATLEPFEQWLKRHSELILMQNSLEKAGESLEKTHDALLPVEKETPGDGIALNTEILNVVQSRCGAVLARNTILKSDAFLGCQRLSLPERLEGASNFRFVLFADIRKVIVEKLHGEASELNIEDFGEGVCGVAMPTVQGVANVIKRLNGTPDVPLIWTCLREEPVLYINNRPYVLRTFQEPLRNLEITGIARERVENMEEQMRQDSLEEMKRYSDRLLLHDEAATRDGFEIVPSWETITQLQTPANIFSSEPSVDYLRIPVTDEQAPIPLVFDELIVRAQCPGIFVFNCQMGRGRTTTGMVITGIIHVVFSLRFHNADIDVHSNVGEYPLILRLVSVLNFGKLAKFIADSVLDACSHMQNLRDAIAQFQLRLTSLSPNTHEYDSTKQIGINYLVRYFYLIAFAGYLLELSVPADDEDFKSNASIQVNIKFSDWLKERREITAILNSEQQQLSSFSSILGLGNSVVY